MTDPCSEALSAAIEAFTRRGSVEPGLDVDGDALLQLRKACRILDAARALHADSEYYTLIVEASFTSIERTLQFYAIHADVATIDELRSHDETFDFAARAGVISDDMATHLIQLWKRYRNGTYYQQRQATALQADAMVGLATCLHEHVTELAGRSHECYCT